jgi:hypothetical protein
MSTEQCHLHLQTGGEDNTRQLAALTKWSNYSVSLVSRFYPDKHFRKSQAALAIEHEPTSAFRPSYDDLEREALRTGMTSLALCRGY